MYNQFGVYGKTLFYSKKSIITGEFRILPDNRLIGTLSNIGEICCREGKKTPQIGLVLGYLEKNTMRFFRFDPDRTISPSGYYLELKSKNQYSGGFIEEIGPETNIYIEGLGEFKGLKELRLAFNAPFEERLEILSKISKELLEYSLKNTLLNKYLTDYNNYAELTLYKE